MDITQRLKDEILNNNDEKIIALLQDALQEIENLRAGNRYEDYLF
jgi:hypothetical protein